MRYCKRCIMPDTKPGIVFDDEGVCSACRSVERKHTIDFPARQARLRALCDEIRGSNGDGYDCVVPVSGGKDSVYQAYMMSRVYGMRTLCVTVSSHLQTREGILNLNAMVENLGLDLIKVSVRPSTQRKLRRIAFLDIGNPAYAEHRVMFAAVARTALFYNAPLVVWGEDIATEYGGNVDDSASDGSAEDLINNDLFRERPFEELVGDAVPVNEIFFYQHPPKIELERRKIRSIYLGYYHWWDGVKHLRIAEQFGFQHRREGPLAGNILAYDNIDEKTCEVHIWFKFLKFGFWRPTDQACYQIWNGRMSREEAVERVREKQYEFPHDYYREFLDYHEITEDEFWETAERFRNRDIWHRVGNDWRLKHELS